MEILSPKKDSLTDGKKIPHLHLHQPANQTGKKQTAKALENAVGPNELVTDKK
jgi:hypothetical protein